MYTVEMDHDEIIITILDDKGMYTDVVINNFDDIVYIRQFEENKNVPQAIAMSPEMFDELIAALHSPEGAFRTVGK